MSIDGKKTGYMKLERTFEPERVTTTETVVIDINRGSSNIAVETIDQSIETLDGRPLAFTARQSISNSQTEIRARITNGQIDATISTAGEQQSKQFAWPSGALLVNGLREHMLSRGLQAGMQTTLKSFLPGSLAAAETVILVHGKEIVDLFGLESELWKVEQTITLDEENESRAIAWVTDEYNIKKMRFSIMGMTLETTACPKACALSESEPTTFFVQSFAASPRPLSDAEQAGVLSYQLEAINSESAIRLPESDEQRVNQNRSGIELVIGSGSNSQFPKPVAADYLGPTRWLQSDAEAVIRLAHKARGSARKSLPTMLSLERFVGEYVVDKNLSVGYASALEVVKDRSGDCTEHAILLAALGRALGIPTRIATGIAYVDSWLGAEQTFVPHAWTQALIGEDWVSFDAALGRYDAGHIALSHGDGDPLGFFSAVNTLGNLRITSVTAQ